MIAISELVALHCNGHNSDTQSSLLPAQMEMPDIP